MLIAALAMVYAGMVEVWRLQKVPEDVSTSGGGGDEQSPGYKPNQAAHLSIFWQAPAYFLIGLSEVFTSIGQLEFFYDQVCGSCAKAALEVLSGCIMDALSELPVCPRYHSFNAKYRAHRQRTVVAWKLVQNAMLGSSFQDLLLPLKAQSQGAGDAEEQAT